MSWEPENNFFKVVGYWQPLITGAAAVLAALGAIWATRDAANKQVKAVQDQIDAATRGDIRKEHLEASAFFSLMDAALQIAEIDLEKAEAIDRQMEAGGTSTELKAARTAFGRTAFRQVRDGLVRHGGELSTPFLELDRKIALLASKAETLSGTHGPIGRNLALTEELAAIKSDISNLRKAVAAEIERIRGLL